MTKGAMRAAISRETCSCTWYFGAKIGFYVTQMKPFYAQGRLVCKEKLFSPGFSFYREGVVAGCK